MRRLSDTPAFRGLRERLTVDRGFGPMPVCPTCLSRVEEREWTRHQRAHQQDAPTPGDADVRAEENGRRPAA